MDIFKLGCKWGSEAPDFYKLIKENRIVFSLKSSFFFKKGDYALITQGHSVKAIVIVLESPKEITERQDLKEEFEMHKIEFSPQIIFSKVDWYELKPEDIFKYELQQGICKVNNIDAIKNTHLLVNQYKSTVKMDSIKNILGVKKQIILQGPPGTGKTFIAKKIASEICIKENVSRPHTITKEDILSIISQGVVFQSYTDKVKYTVVSIKDSSIDIKSENSEPYNASYEKISEAYGKMINGDKPENKNGNDPYVLACAKYVYENINVISTNTNIKLIQFHPAYNYEDFVRGISAKTNGTQVEYKTENRVLGDFAEKALINYNNSKKNIELVSFENKVDVVFQQYLQSLNERFEDGKIFLNGSSRAYISRIDSTFLKYYETEYDKSGDGFPITFDELKNLFINSFSDDYSEYFLLRGYYHKHIIRELLNDFRSFYSENSTLVNDQDNNQLLNYVLIIDEINRANLPAVLGELIYALEYRGDAVESMYELDGDREIILPPNLYIIGTMNTADRSVGHIDYAIRRRFAFVSIFPKRSVVEQNGCKQAQKLFDKVAALFVKDYSENNESIGERSEFLSSEFNAEDVMIGHSYFLETDIEKLKLRLLYEIKPILREYLKDGILLDNAKKEIDALSVES